MLEAEPGIAARPRREDFPLVTKLPAQFGREQGGAEVDVDQTIGLTCYGLAAGLARGEVRQADWVTVGEMLLDHPKVLEDIRGWFYRVQLDALRAPDMAAEVRRRNTTPEEGAGQGARGLLHLELFPLTLTDMYRRVADALADPEVVAAPYPFAFGEPIRREEAAKAARGLRQRLRQASGLTLDDLYGPPPRA